VEGSAVLEATVVVGGKKPEDIRVLRVVIHAHGVPGILSAEEAHTAREAGRVHAAFEIDAQSLVSQEDIPRADSTGKLDVQSPLRAAAAALQEERGDSQYRERGGGGDGGDEGFFGAGGIEAAAGQSPTVSADREDLEAIPA
jgi:hypothetical protein